MYNQLNKTVARGLTSSRTKHYRLVSPGQPISALNGCHCISTSAMKPANHRLLAFDVFLLQDAIKLSNLAHSDIVKSGIISIAIIMSIHCYEPKPTL